MGRRPAHASRTARRTHHPRSQLELQTKPASTIFDCSSSSLVTSPEWKGRIVHIRHEEYGVVAALADAYFTGKLVVACIRGPALHSCSQAYRCEEGGEV